MPNVSFTRESAQRLKQAYVRATKEGKQSFIFEGNEYVVDYAKYLLEYLATKFGSL
jgi:hypothetical protein